MIIAIITRLRIQQLRNILVDAGILYSAISISVALGGLIWLYQASELYNFIAPAVLGVALLSIQSQRKDKAFLALILRPAYVIQFAEYLIIAIPFIIINLMHQQWESSLAGFAMVLLVPFVPRTNRKDVFLNALWDLLPARYFEIRAGMRRYGILIIIIWCASIVFSAFPATIPILLLITVTTTFSFYEHCEPLNIIRSFELNANKFLLGRLKIVLGLFVIYSSVPTFIYAFVHPQYLYILLIELVIFTSLLWYVIVLKYAFYTPNTKVNSRLFSALAPAAVFVPIIYPLALAMAVHFHIKATTKLKIYLG